MSQRRSTHSIPNLVTLKEHPEDLLHGAGMTNETSYEMVRPTRASFMNKAETIALCIKELGRAYCQDVDERKDELIDKVIMDNYILHKKPEKPSGGPTVDYIKRSEVENLMEYKIKAAIEITTWRVDNWNWEDTIEEAFATEYDEQKERVKAPIRNIVEGASISIVEQGFQDTILMRNVDMLTRSTQ